MVDNNVLNKQKELVQVLFKKASGDQSGAGTSSSSPEDTSSTPITMGGGTGLPTTTGTSGVSTPFGNIPREPFADEPTPGQPGPFGHPMIGAGTGTQTGTQRPVSTGFNPTGYRFDGENIYQPEADRNGQPRRTMSPISEYKKTPETKGTPWIDSLLNTLSENKFAVGGGLGGALLGALAGGENKLLWSLLLGGLGAGAGYMFDRD